jgi:hypothetical protein
MTPKDDFMTPHYRFVRALVTLGIVLAPLLAPPFAASQTGSRIPARDPGEDAPVHLGPVALTPSIGLTNLGIDSNVFNEVDDPKRDVTFTLAPQLGAWVRAGRSRTEIKGQTDLVYFHRYASERSLDGSIEGRFAVPGNRVTPWIGGGYRSGRQRVGYEIDLRSRRITTDADAGVEVRVGGKTRIGVSGARQRTRHDGDAFFQGSSLATTLNRRTDTYGLEYRQSWTVLTTFVAQADAIRDRFEFSPGRNSNSLRVQAGLDLEPRALINGRVRIGYRRFDGVAAGLPGYSGLVAAFMTGATFGGRTRLELSGERDVTYSIEQRYPYYILTGATLSVTPRLTKSWDVQGRVGLQRLAYQPFALDEILDRVDRHRLFGGGVGYYLGRDVRVGFNVDRQRRRSPVQARDYDGYRVGVSVTYGR